MLDQIFKNPRTSMLGAAPGGLLIEDSIRDVAARPDDWFAWVRMLVGVLSVVVGFLMKDATPNAPASVTRNRSS